MIDPLLRNPAAEPLRPDVLVVGHIVKDIVAEGWRPGGSVVYATTQAVRLGLRVAAVTVCSSDVNPSAVVRRAAWHVAADDVTTTFENRYANGKREQRLPALAAPLTLDDLPEEWRAAPIILLAPVFHDVDPKLPAQLAGPGRLIGLGAQGWLRRRDGDRVLPGWVEPAPEWLAGHVVFVSDEDVADYPDAVAVWQKRVPCVVMTHGAGGCTVWNARGRHEVAAFPTDEVDPTGAGDVFAAAFLVRLKETGDTLEAANFGAAAAAYAVSEPGLDGIAGRDDIEALVRARGAVTA